MITMQLDAANNLFSIAGSILGLLVMLIALIGAFVKLQINQKATDRELKRVETDLVNAKAEISKRHDGLETKLDNLQSSLSQLFVGLGRIEGKLEVRS
jgi:ABC-type phosphate transport system auxiliary subunit